MKNQKSTVAAKAKNGRGLSLTAEIWLILAGLTVLLVAAGLASRHVWHDAFPNGCNCTVIGGVVVSRNR